MEFDIQKIGTVEAGDEGFYIQVDDAVKQGLIGLEGFSHLNIVWWGHHYDDASYRDNLVIDKPYKTGPEQIGVFATRSPMRPNPILLTVISVMKLDIGKGRIYTPYIDAEEGTPVLDIKPYFPCSDISSGADTPKWCAILPKSIEESAEFDWSTFFNFEE